MLKKANDLYVAKKYMPAIKIYAKILKDDADDFASLANTATAYFELKKYSDSIPFFRRVILMDSTNPWWYNYMSQSLQKCGEFDDALYNAWQAVLHGENDNAHHLNLAYTIYEISDEKGRKKTDSILKKWYKKYPENQIAEQCYKSYFYDQNFSRSNPKYVEELFDVFAPDFDNVLAGLNYDSPKIIAQILSDFLSSSINEKITILDLGCGSGLCGKYIKKIFKKSHITGVDISAKMLENAKKKNVYDRLIKCDIDNCFCNEKYKFDAVVASDVLTYFGELDSIFKKVVSILNEKGVFVFTVSKNQTNENDYFLMPSSRFVHSYKYVKETIKKYGFDIIKFEEKILRKEGEKDVFGTVYLIKKR